jgi:O-antigen/teichoic acid export membrane protein
VPFVTDTVAQPTATPGGAPPGGSDRATLGGVARGGVLNMIGAAFSSLAGFAVTVLTVRGLGKDQAGVLFSATAAFLIATMVAKLGTPTALVYWLSRLRVLNRHDLLRRCLTVALGPVVIAGLLTGAALYIWAPAAAELSLTNSAKTSAADLADFITQLRILAFIVPAAALSDALLAATRGYRTMRATVLIEKILRPLVQILALAAAIIVGTHATTAFNLASAGPFLISAALAWWWLARLTRRQRRFDRGESPDTTELSSLGVVSTQHFTRDFWRFTTPRAFASVIQLVLQRSGVLMVASLIGFGPAALFTAATRFVVVGQLGNQAISTAVQPRLAESLTKGDRREANTLYQSATGWLVMTAWPLYVLTAVFAPVYLRLFGSGFTSNDAVAVIWLMAFATVFATGCGMVDMVLAMAGRTSWNLINVIVALIVNVILSLLLIPPYGLVGAAIAWAAAVVVDNAIPVVQISRSLKLQPFGRGSVLAGGLAIVVFGGIGWLTRLLLPDSLGSQIGAMMITLVVGGVIYLAGIWRLRGSLRLAAFTAMRRRGKPSTPSATEG